MNEKVYLETLEKVYQTIQLIRESEDEDGEYFDTTDAILRIDRYLGGNNLDKNHQELIKILKK